MNSSEKLVRAATDSKGAEWITRRLMRWCSLPGGEMPVGAFIPLGFDSYLRILHPAYRISGAGDVPVRWAQFAQQLPSGTSVKETLDDKMKWEHISSGVERTWRHLLQQCGVKVAPEIGWDEIASIVGRVGPEILHLPPHEGHLPAEEAAVLVEVLRRHTTTPMRCWFAVWEGFGVREADRISHGATRLHLPDRDYVLLRGPIDVARRSFLPSPFRQSASLWWPEDRVWCVATEIDYRWTYVGGTESCIDDLLEGDRLEALRTAPREPAGGPHLA